MTAESDTGPTAESRDGFSTAPLAAELQAIAGNPNPTESPGTPTPATTNSAEDTHEPDAEIIDRMETNPGQATVRQALIEAGRHGYVKPGGEEAGGRLVPTGPEGEAILAVAQDALQKTWAARQGDRGGSTRAAQRNYLGRQAEAARKQRDAADAARAQIATVSDSDSEHNADTPRVKPAPTQPSKREQRHARAQARVARTERGMLDVDDAAEADLRRQRDRVSENEDADVISRASTSQSPAGARVIDLSPPDRPAPTPPEAPPARPATNPDAPSEPLKVTDYRRVYPDGSFRPPEAERRAAEHARVQDRLDEEAYRRNQAFNAQVDEQLEDEAHDTKDQREVDQAEADRRHEEVLGALHQEVQADTTRVPNADAAHAQAINLDPEARRQYEERQDLEDQVADRAHLLESQIDARMRQIEAQIQLTERTNPHLAALLRAERDRHIEALRARAAEDAVRIRTDAEATHAAGREGRRADLVRTAHVIASTLAYSAAGQFSAQEPFRFPQEALRNRDTRSLFEEQSLTRRELLNTDGVPFLERRRGGSGLRHPFNPHRRGPRLVESYFQAPDHPNVVVVERRRRNGDLVSQQMLTSTEPVHQRGPSDYLPQPDIRQAIDSSLEADLARLTALQVPDSGGLALRTGRQFDGPAGIYAEYELNRQMAAGASYDQADAATQERLNRFRRYNKRRGGFWYWASGGRI